MIKILNILAIVLPLLIIVLGLIRYYSDGRRNFGGTITFLALLLLLMGVFRYFFIGNGGGGSGSSDSGSRQDPISVSKHSVAFNNSMENVLGAYYRMTEGFVNWDTAVINHAGNELKTALDSLRLDEMQKDTLIYLTVLDYYNNAKAEVASIIADPSIAKRGSLNILSDQLKTIWTSVKYDGQKAYWQECPMAFGEDKPGNWLSKTKEVRNPYLGTKHPEYGDGMLECGGPKDTIKFEPTPVRADTTKTK